MGFLIDRWRRIGTRLYIALGFAVFLTLVSSAIGVYYFEQSGDLNFRIRSESAPVLEAAWNVDRDISRLRSLGLSLLSESDPSVIAGGSDAVANILGSVEASLQVVNSNPALATSADAVYSSAFETAGIVDEIALSRQTQLEADAAAVKLGSRLSNLSVSGGANETASLVLYRAIATTDDEALDELWNEFMDLSSVSIDQSLADLAGDNEGVFAVRGSQLLLRTRIAELSTNLDDADARLSVGVTQLVSEANGVSVSDLESAGRTFDQGRLLLAVVSVASVLAATLAAWLWVGNDLLRRLFSLSERMRSMARGDLETPMPEVGADEIGELAGALEVFRRQALEVQRLNLVEQLYGELREANEELTRMQARLVANEKLAALGELVSGVAHEISNPLNFVKNFSEGSMELFDELTEIVDNYRDALSEEDAEALEEVKAELTDSLNRVQENGGRVLAIVDRMRGLGVVGGEPEPADLNTELRMAVQASCISFANENDGFEVKPSFEFDDSVGEVMLAAHDFGEAVKNLVSNACFAMRIKSESLDGSYTPSLTSSTQRVGDVIEVKFRDNGTGISDEAVGRIFDPFFSTRDGALGAGLGLPVASDVARRAGGDLIVDTVPGDYAEFTMTVPAGKDEQV